MSYLRILFNKKVVASGDLTAVTDDTQEMDRESISAVEGSTESGEVGDDARTGFVEDSDDALDCLIDCLEADD